jgi:starvation-inducible DNA-binding protein
MTTGDGLALAEPWVEGVVTVKMDIGIPEDQRKEVAAALAPLLADTYALYLKTQNYHWNVTGPRFRELHAMFEDQYRALAEAVDEVAERIRTLGFWAPATFGEFARLTSLEEEESVPDAEAMVGKLLEGHEVVLRTARRAMGVAQEARDEGTVDLMVARMAHHEKTGWMLASTGSR